MDRNTFDDDDEDQPNKPKTKTKQITDIENRTEQNKQKIVVQIYVCVLFQVWKNCVCHMNKRPRPSTVTSINWNWKRFSRFSDRDAIGG